MPQLIRFPLPNQKNAIISLPDTVDSFQVIQLYFGSQPAIFGWTEDKSHGIKLEEILRGSDRVHKMVEIEESGERIPAINGNNYRLIGAGTGQKINGLYEFNGRSQHYPIGINAYHLDEITKEDSNFQWIIKPSILL